MNPSFTTDVWTPKLKDMDYPERETDILLPSAFKIEKSWRFT